MQTSKLLPSIPPGCCCQLSSSDISKADRRKRSQKNIFHIDTVYALIGTKDLEVGSESNNDTSEIFQWFACRVIGTLSFHQEGNIDGTEPSILLLYRQSTRIVGSFSNWKTSGIVLSCFEGTVVEKPSTRSRDQDFGMIRINVKNEFQAPFHNCDTRKAIFALVTRIPIPAVSVSLKFRVNGADGNTNSMCSQQPLLMSCLKKQLIGSLMLLQRDICEPDKILVSTEYHLSFDDKEWVFRIHSSPTTAKPSTGTVFSLIVPGTTITLLPQKHDISNCRIDDQIKESTCNSNSKHAMNHAIQLLFDTIHCIKASPEHSRIDVPRAFVLSGDPGVGKTYSVKVACEQLSCRLVVYQGSEMLACGSPAQAAAQLLQSFETAAHAQPLSSNPSTSVFNVNSNPSVVFIDELDALMTSRPIVSMIGWILDRLSIDPAWKRLVFVGATNRIDTISGELRRPGRFDKEIPLSQPDAETRYKVLKVMLDKYTSTSSQNVSGSESEDNKDLRAIALACVGYVPADLAALVDRSNQILRSDDSTISTSGASRTSALKQAMLTVGASALRDAALKAPSTTTWADIAGDPGGSKTALRKAIEWPRINAASYKALQLSPPRGILLHGPPGCAKTSLAKAAAGVSGVAFLSLAPADVYASSFVGEAEAVIRRAFSLARSAAPCVLFFDEIDSILETGGDGSRSGHGMSRGNSSSAEARVLSTFLNEMDGIDGSLTDGVLVLGATNRPWTLDAAILRPGRFEKIVYVPPPDVEGRRAILEMQCQRWNLSNRFDLDLLASDKISGNFTGAEILGACQDAAMKALHESIIHDNEAVVTERFLLDALANVRPLLSNKIVMDNFMSFERSRKIGKT